MCRRTSSTWRSNDAGRDVWSRPTHVPRRSEMPALTRWSAHSSTLMWTIGAAYWRRPRDLSDPAGAWCISERIPVSSDRSRDTPDLGPRDCTLVIAERNERTPALDWATVFVVESAPGTCRLT